MSDFFYSPTSFVNVFDKNFFSSEEIISFRNGFFESAALNLDVLNNIYISQERVIEVRPQNFFSGKYMQVDMLPLFVWGRNKYNEVSEPAPVLLNYVASVEE